jgi:hypothetical protein
MEAHSFALKNEQSARLLHLCPGLNIAYRNVMAAAGSTVYLNIPCITHKDNLCDPGRILQRYTCTEARERKCDI